MAIRLRTFDEPEMNHATQRVAVSVVGICITAFLAVAPVGAMPSAVSSGGTLDWQYEYDEQDRLTATIDPAGRKTRLLYTVDKENRLRRFERTTEDGVRVIREFDEAGRLSKMIDGAGTVSYGYDSESRLNLVGRKGSPAITYTYDSLDRLTRLQVGDFYRIDYRYDYLGRLQSMNTPAGDIRYEYLTGQGQILRRLPNGVNTIWQFAVTGQLEKITHVDAKNVVLAQYTYHYRADGLIEAIDELSPNGLALKAYKYDLAGRLVEAVGPGGRRYAYEYDQVGNMLKSTVTGKPDQTYSYNWAGQVTALDGKPSEHDAAGNLTSVPGSGLPFRYRYNHDGQLAEVLNSKTLYRYDGEGNLVGRTNGGIETTFVPNPLASVWQPLVATGKKGRMFVVWEGNQPLMLIAEGKPEYLLHDHLGSTRLTADKNGRINHRYDYEPFGALISDDGTSEFTPRFSGLFWDAEANAYVTLARGYSPLIGRWLQPDPVQLTPDGDQQDRSVYAYCFANPVNWVDRDGAEPERPVSKWTNFLTAFMEGRFVGTAYGDQLLAHFALRWAETDNPVWAIPGGIVALWTKDTWADTLFIVIAGLAMNSHSVGLKILEKARTPKGILNAFRRWVWEERTTKYTLRTNRAAYTVTAKAKDMQGRKIHFDHLWISQQWAKRFAFFRPFANAGGNLFPVPSWFNTMVGALEKSSNPVMSRVKGFLYHSIPRLQVLAAALFGGKYGWYRGTRIIEEWASLSPPKTEASQKEATRKHLTKKPLPQEQQHLPQPLLCPPFCGNGGDGGDSGDPPPPPPGGGGGGSPILSSASRVGGVYLSGASKLLDGLGQLEGVALDANNNLILIGKGGTDIGLPPLRLDDVVTIFRSVYLHGEGPMVTIDPNPEKPEESAMIIRHGKATEQTYVGWVLYQADRLMKGYSLGRDNITTHEVKSRDPDYATQVLDKMYFGNDTPGRMRQQGRWERFWIVPGDIHQTVATHQLPRPPANCEKVERTISQLRRFESSKNGLTLFDIPLKVNTQPMKWVKGELVDDCRAKPSPGATIFSRWFSEKYDLIAEEQFLTPPAESGIVTPVPVFTELRRFALLTAIAEKLRDQGVPLPFWMRDYEVRPVPFERFTPALRMGKSRGGVTSQIFGGVNLLPPDKVVLRFTPSSDLTKLPAGEQAAVRGRLTLADSLVTPVQQATAFAEPLAVRHFSHNGTRFHVVALPGTATQAPAPGRLEEVDVVVPIEGGRSIELGRSFHSFFDPTGPWGKGWALDLPQLVEVPMPVKREGQQTMHQLTYELLTPLNRLYAHFSRIEDVPALNHSRLQVPDRPSEFLGLANDQPTILTRPTRKVFLKDGTAWHFIMAGALAAIEDNGFWTVYERDEHGRVSKIVGLLGRRPVAFIDLSYNSSGQLVSAKGRRTSGTPSEETSVQYEYDATGRLAGVISGTSRRGYRYQGSWVTAVTHATVDKHAKLSHERTLRSFDYNALGQVTSVGAPDGTKTSRRITADADGITVETTQSEPSARTASFRFDRAFRPMWAISADGGRSHWSYPDQGGITLDLTDPEGHSLHLTESADQRRLTMTLDGNHRFTSEYDSAGRLTAFSQNGRPLLLQEWTPDGRLAGIKDEFAALHPAYDEDGLLAKVMMSPPGETRELKHWQATTLNPTGQPLEVTDSQGLHRTFAYASTGELESAVEHRDGKRYGFQVSRDKSGLVQRIESSWGKHEYDYDREGQLAKATFKTAGAQATAEWTSGLVQKVHHLDGGVLSFSYYQDNKRAGLLKDIRTPDRLALHYEYDGENRIAKVTVGDRYQIALEYDGKGRLAAWRTRPATR